MVYVNIVVYNITVISVIPRILNGGGRGTQSKPEFDLAVTSYTIGRYYTIAVMNSTNN